MGAIVAYSFNVALGLFALILLLGALATAAIDVETKQKPLT